MIPDARQWRFAINISHAQQRLPINLKTAGESPKDKNDYTVIALNNNHIKKSERIFLPQREVACQDLEEEFEDIKGAIRIRISKNRQHNDQHKKYKRTNNDLHSIHIKLKTE